MDQENKGIYEFGDFQLDIGKGILLRDGNPVSMQWKTFELLCTLVKSNGNLLTRDELMNELWADTFVEENNLSQHIRLLRKALDDGETLFIETIPRKGYRFVAPVVENAAENNNKPIEKADLETSVSNEQNGKLPTSHGKSRQRFITVTALLVVFLLGGYFFYSRLLIRPKQNRLAILPLTNLQPNDDADFLGYALADALIAKLAPIKSLGVLPISSVSKYKNQTLSPQEAAKDLKADLLLTGSYLKDGDRLKINAQLVNIPQNKIVYQDNFEIDYRNLSDSQEFISRRLIRALGLSLSEGESVLLQKQQPRNQKAYELYLRGIDYYGAGRLPLAIENFEKSILLDPDFANLGAISARLIW